MWKEKEAEFRKHVVKLETHKYLENIYELAQDTRMLWLQFVVVVI